MYTCDLETDAIDELNPDLVTTIHCIALKKDNEETKLYHGESLEQCYSILRETDEPIVFHNGLRFDVPVLAAIANVYIKSQIIDTFVMSCTLNSDRDGGHSLKSWGIRTKTYKGEFDDWSAYSDEMGEYCIGDVEATRAAYLALVKEMATHPKGGKGWGEAMRLEHKMAAITAVQRRNGIKVDQEHCHKTLEYIDERMEEIAQIVEPLLPDREPNKGEKNALTPPAKQFLKSGKPNSYAEKWFDEIVDRDGVYYGTKFDMEFKLPHNKPVKEWLKVTLKNQADLKDWLISKGWKPTIWNYKKKDGKNVRVKGKLVKTSPKFHESGKVCEGLRFVDFDHIELVIEWLSLKHRHSLITGILGNVRTDGRIGADGNPCGTPTARYTHKTVVNIPKNDPKVVLGKECREIFVADDGKVVVGSDASGLEFRMLAHYMNDPEFTHELLQGDIHTILWKVCEDLIPSRGVTKNTEYCMTYGGSDSKMGETAGHAGKEAAVVGKEIRTRWMGRFPSLGELTNKVVKAAERGYLLGIDGRMIHVRYSHAALNSLLQSAGSIVVKTATAYAYDRLPEGEAKIIGHWHDEWLVECNEGVKDEVMTLLHDGMIHAEEKLGIRCPLAADAAFGNSWAEVH